MQAGHEILDGSGHIVQAVYRVEVVPDDLSSEYSLQVARYSFNLAQTGLNETYSHAFTLPGRIGADGDVFGQITNETFACGTVINWVEVVNVKPTPVVATVTFRSASGATLGSAMDTIPGHGQLHYYAGSVLPAGQIGTVQVSSTVLESIIAESLVYIADCDTNGLQTAYLTRLYRPGLIAQSGSANSFIGMDNLLRVVSTTGALNLINWNLISYIGEQSNGNFNVGALGTTGLSFTNNPDVNFPANRYGIFTLTSDAASEFVAETLRVRLVSERGKIRHDFVLPTVVR